MPETIGDRLAAAQNSGDPALIRAALLEAKEAGADPAQCEAALAEMTRMAAGGAPRSAPDGTALSSAPSSAPGAGADTPPADDAAAAAAAAAAAEVARTSAEGHKKRGNEQLKNNTKSAAREALECFTTGIEVGCSDNVLNAQLFSNRAHVRILLRQWVEAVDDCRKAIGYDRKNMKAYWRASKASLQLDLCKNGIEFCEAGLRIQPDDAELMKMRAACAEKLEGQQRRKADIAASAQINPDFNADEAMALQERVNGLLADVDGLRQSLGQKQRDRIKVELTRNQLGVVPKEQNAFVSIGRCFLKADRDELNTTLTETHESLEAEIPKLAKALQEMENRKDAAEKELKEMIKTFRQTGSEG